MTTISPFAAGSYLTTRSTSQLLAMKSQLDALTTQLSTGRTAETYGGLGAGRSSSLTARATLSALDASPRTRRASAPPSPPSSAGPTSTAPSTP
jgi:hypothetical protein